MCHFITTILPKDAKQEKLKLLFREHGFDFRIVEDFHLADQLEKGDLCVQTSRGICDCGTIIGSLARSVDYSSAQDEILNKSIARFRKKGWSERQIQDWINKSKEDYFLRSIKRKFKNKNISDAKIQKWKEQSAENLRNCEITETEFEEKLKTALPQTRQWSDFLKAVLDSNFTSRIGLLIHDYSGKHGNKIVLQDKEKIKSEDFLPRILLEVREDVIYEFIP